METITLKHPVIQGQRTVSELNLQDPKVKHMARTDGHPEGSVASDIALLSALSGEPEIIIENIDFEDWALIRIILQRMYLKFFGIDPDKEQKEAATENPPKPEVPA